MERTLETNFCFGLVCKVVVEVQNSFILFSFMGWSNGHNTKGKLLLLLLRGIKER
jgi:hypothetical protein